MRQGTSFESPQFFSNLGPYITITHHGKTSYFLVKYESKKGSSFGHSGDTQSSQHLQDEGASPTQRCSPLQPRLLLLRGCPPTTEGACPRPSYYLKLAVDTAECTKNEVKQPHNFLTAQLVRPRKFFSLSHFFHTPTIVVLLSLTFSYAISLFDTQFLHLSTSPIVINFNVATNFFLKLIRVAMVLTAFLNVIPVSHISWF